MESELPQWANLKASTDLPSWMEKGESSDLEFKKQIPEDKERLSREAAAMATSGGGKILLGVSDDGSLVGLRLTTGDERDAYIERVQGIVNIVQPPIDVDIEFAVHDSKTALVIDVLAQDHPVSYVAHRPYIRDGRRSRPARPHEVVERVSSHPSSDARRERERQDLEARGATLQAIRESQRQLGLEGNSF